MSTPFKQLPTLEQVATKVFNVHTELRALSEGMGNVVTALESNVQENNKLTDAALEEINLKLAFLMTMIAVKTPTNSGIADASGKVGFVTKPALQVYLEGGRAKMIAERETFMEQMREQGLQAATSDAEDRDDATGQPLTLDRRTGPSGTTH